MSHIDTYTSILNALPSSNARAMLVRLEAFEVKLARNRRVAKAGMTIGVAVLVAYFIAVLLEVSGGVHLPLLGLSSTALFAGSLLAHGASAPDEEGMDMLRDSIIEAPTKPTLERLAVAIAEDANLKASLAARGGIEGLTESDVRRLLMAYDDQCQRSDVTSAMAKVKNALAA